MSEDELKANIKTQLEKYDNKKDLSRGFAVGLKLATAILGAIVTVLLGWKFEDNKQPLYMLNLALICGAIIAVMNTLDTFWSFSARWANYKAICTELIFLQSDVEREKNLTEVNINSFDLKLQQIIKDAKRVNMELYKKRNS